MLRGPMFLNGRIQLWLVGIILPIRHLLMSITGYALMHRSNAKSAAAWSITSVCAVGRSGALRAMARRHLTGR